MSVLITVDVKNQTAQGYDQMLAVLADCARKSPGFVVHSAYADDSGAWRVVEIWETLEDANRFFAQHVAPHLPPGVRPKRHVQQLHSLVKP